MASLKLKIAFLMVWALWSCAWGSMAAPNVCSFGDPEFGTLSHQHVEIQEPSAYHVGEENFVIIKLEKPELPSGYMVRVFVDTLQAPKEEPEVQGWYPKTSIKPLVEGKYELLVRVNLMYKGS